MKVNLYNWPCTSPNQCPNIDFQITTSKDSIIFRSGGVHVIYDAMEEAGITLPNGKYYLNLNLNGWKPVTGFSATVDWEESLNEYNSKVGGLRIAQMEDFNSPTEKSITKIYKYVDDQGKTTGRISQLPSYGYVFTERVPAPDANAAYYNDYYARSSTPTIPLGMTQGNPVGDSQVTVNLVSTLIIIVKQGMPDVFHMHPDLVFPSGFQLHVQQ